MSKTENLIVVGTYNNSIIIGKIENINEKKVLKKIREIQCCNQAIVHSCIVDNDAIYAVDSFNSMVIKYNIGTDDYSECTTGKSPRHLCKVKNKIYVTNFESESISIIDDNTMSLDEIISVGIKPHGIVCDCEGENIYVACYEEKVILKYNVNKRIYNKIKIEGYPMHLIIDEDRLFILSNLINGNINSKVDIIRGKSGEIYESFYINCLVTDFVYDHINNAIYLISIEENGVHLIDLKTGCIKTQLYINKYFEDISIGCKNGYIANSNRNSIFIIDKEKLTFHDKVKVDFLPNYIKQI